MDVKPVPTNPAHTVTPGSETRNDERDPRRNARGRRKQTASTQLTQETPKEPTETAAAPVEGQILDTKSFVELLARRPGPTKEMLATFSRRSLKKTSSASPNMVEKKLDKAA